MISDGRLKEVLDGDILFTDEQRELAKELLALRNQPVSQHYKLPEGWKLVPVDPTEDMIIAISKGLAERVKPSRYRAMLAAAPEVE